MITRSAALAMCLLAAACGQKADDGNSVATTAEVLPGSISDSMIDLDTSTASPPMAPVRADPVKKAARTGSDASEEDEAEPAAAPAPAADAAESTDTE